MRTILAKGIDVSKYQGNIDWKKVKQAGIEFAMIRVGYRGYSNGKIVLDPCFKKNITEALANGIKVGIYFFSTAISVAEAKEDAEWTLNQIKGHNVTYPIVFDYEGFELEKYRSYGTNKTKRTAFNQAFIDVIKKAGFKTMIYGSKGNIKSTYDIASLNEPLWCARYSGGYTKILDDDKYFPAIAGFDIAMWQYTSIGKVPGINGNVDMNYMYINLEKGSEVKVEEKPEKEKGEEYNMPTLRLGSEGKAVKVWQIIVGVKADGVFGSKTNQATLDFQKKYGLEMDGVVGPKTWAKGLEIL